VRRWSLTRGVDREVAGVEEATVLAQVGLACVAGPAMAVASLAARAHTAAAAVGTAAGQAGPLVEVGTTMAAVHSWETAEREAVSPLDPLAPQARLLLAAAQMLAAPPQASTHSPNRATEAWPSESRSASFTLTSGGEGGIRTHEELAPLTVFKCASGVDWRGLVYLVSRSATLGLGGEHGTGVDSHSLNP